MVVIWVAKAERTQNNSSTPPLAPSRAAAVPVTRIRHGLLSHRRVHCVAGFIPTGEMDRDHALCFFVSCYSEQGLEHSKYSISTGEKINTSHGTV